MGAKDGATLEKISMVWFISSKIAQGYIRLDKNTKKVTSKENLS